MLDGIDGAIPCHGAATTPDPRCDAFFDYIGSLQQRQRQVGRGNSSTTNTPRTRASGRCSAATRSASAFSGTYTDEGAVAEATALAGKRSIRFSAVLKKLAEA